MAATGVSPSSSTREFHLVIWGATGFTGKQACMFLVENYGLPSANLKYAIGGRTQSRLDSLEAEMVSKAKELGKDNGASSVTKILSNVDDASSMTAMCKRAGVVAAYAGPYALCGEAVVRACVEAKTHYVDITGEMGWVIKMHETYHDKAVAAKLKIVPACGGVDFVPFDAAMVHLANNCESRGLDLQSVHQRVSISNLGVSGGTIRSICEMSREMSLSSLTKLMSDPYALCKIRPSQAIVDANKMGCCPLKRNVNAAGWTSPFFLSEGAAQYLRWSNEVQNFAWGPHLVLKVSRVSDSFWRALMSLIIVWIMPYFAWFLSRVRADKFAPQSGTGTFEAHKSSGTHRDYFNIELTGEATERTSKTLKTITCEYKCPYEGYWLTGITGVECALAAVFDETPPKSYGVVTPAAALGQALVTRLEKYDIAGTKPVVK